MDYFIHLSVVIVIYSILALSLNVLAGYTGLISMAVAAFMGLGAYCAAFAMTHFGMSFFLALPLAMLFSAIVALLVDFVLARFKGDYFTLGSLGIVAITSGLFINGDSLTGGAVGIANIPRPVLFGLELSENWQMLVLALLLLCATYGICQWVAKSSFGRVLRAIREDEGAIGVFGFDVARYKLVVFVISGALAASAGAFFAAYASFISPVSFTLSESIMVLTMVILGGIANNKGAIWGAIALVLVPELLRFVGLPAEIAADTKNILYGVILIVLMLYRPQGLIGEYRL